ncbi:hypothetical protein [Bradyrhizobium sp. LHD-71]|uniref:hypothetical protein n=1 Tax=Bradyrhizobium sp. LHD-71 TaxID=3072141 RepID=UPI00280E6A34|nr:hypothetical protein [Bradyrhizobium sp. LHD-71]MDQ8731131.1 hypothetical protein [Bradyrhizobium sp. LHD-71]
MVRSYRSFAAVFAFPLLIVASAADAQSMRGKNQASDAALAARQECFREAQARFPGPGGEISVQKQRETAYRGCAQRKGVRP